MNTPKPSQQKLSPALEKAVRDFNASSTKRMASANQEDEPKQPLFHYTNQAALFGIIESETFWFSSIYHMDDTEELAFGFKVQQALLAEKVAGGDTISKLFCEELVGKDELKKIKGVFEFYSVSFGTKDDARQWESYADKGRGVAFGLAPAFFKPLLKTAPTPEEMVFLGKVVYGDARARARHLPVIDEAIATIKSMHSAGNLKAGPDTRLFFQHMAAEMGVETLWNCVTTKDDSWSHQNETRLLALNYLKAPHLEIHNASRRPRLEIPQPLLKASITEVMLGPEASVSTEADVRRFLDAQNLHHVQVTRSNGA